jgi:hypothetical protein
MHVVMGNRRGAAGGSRVAGVGWSEPRAGIAWRLRSPRGSSRTARPTSRVRSGRAPQDPLSYGIRARVRAAREEWDAAPADFEAASRRTLSDFNEANRLDPMHFPGLRGPSGCCDRRSRHGPSREEQIRTHNRGLHRGHPAGPPACPFASRGWQMYRTASSGEVASRLIRSVDPTEARKTACSDGWRGSIMAGAPTA